MFFPQLATWTFAVAWLASSGASSPAVSGSSAAADLFASSTLTLKKQVEEVRVSFAVRDGHKLVKNLEFKQLTFLDNGRAPAAITTFVQDSNLPLQVALVIDHSDSMQKGFDAEQEAAREFLERFLRPGIDSWFVVDFSGSVSVSGLGSGHADEIKTVTGLRASGQTAVYDAVFAATQAFEKLSRSSEPSRRVMLLLSDGEDNYSRTAIADAVQAAQRADVTIFALTAHNPNYVFRGDAVLRRMADVTGGKAFILKSYVGVNTAFQQIEDQLRTEYSVTFRPATPRLCGFHTVRIFSRDRKLQIAAREGYYACSE